MAGYTDVFGGQTVQPADVGYRAVALAANVTLSWPAYATDSNFVAGIMEVTPSGASFTMTMPDATLVSPGQTIVWRNLGAYSFTVADASGNPIAVISAGAARLMWLQTNAVAAGTWASILLGVGSSSNDASQLTGLGLRAIANTINLAPVTTTFNANYSVVSTDRGKVFVWTGGSGTLTLPALASASSSPDFEIEVRNQGTGVLTVATTGGEQIDASGSATLNTTESCFVHAGPTAWYTVGRGRNTQFNFTKLAKSVTGGTTTLSQTEAANVIQVYTGVLASNETVVVPATVQVYYITNNTTGAHTFTVQSPVAGGASVTVSQNATAVLYCDGTNVVNCNTSGVTVNAVQLSPASAGAPSLSFVGDATTGVYQPSSGQFAISISGTQAFLLTSTGINNTAIGATTPSTGRFTTVNKITITQPATGSTLTIVDGKTLTANNSVALTGTDGSTITFGAGGTVVYAGAATSSGLTQSTGKLLGRTTAATGAIEEILPGSNMSLSAGALSMTPLYGAVSGSNFTTSSQTLVDITGLSIALAANTTYAFTATVSFQSASGAGCKFAVNFSAAGAVVEASSFGGSANTSPLANRISAFATATQPVGLNGGTDSVMEITGVVATGANAGNLTIQIEKASSVGTNLTVYTGSQLHALKVA